MFDRWMNSQTVLSQGEGMTDNSSYGRLQSWAVRVSYTSLQLQSKISVEGRERPYHHERCGRRPEISVVRKETEKPNALPKPHPAAFRPLFVFFWTVCPWLFCYEQSSCERPLFITQHLTVHQCFCMCKQRCVCLFMRSCHFR